MSTSHEPIAVDTDGTAEILDAELLDDTHPTDTSPAVAFDQRAAVTQLLVLRQVIDRVKALDTEIRAQLAQHMLPGDNIAGCLDPADPKGTALGKVGMNNGREIVDLTDEDDLMAFVRDAFPTELVTVTQIRPAFLTKLKDAVKTHGGWLTDQGELLEVPGLTKTIGDPGLAVRPSKDAAAIVDAAVTRGQLHLDGTRAIEAGQ